MCPLNTCSVSVLTDEQRGGSSYQQTRVKHRKGAEGSETEGRYAFKLSASRVSRL